MGGMELLAQNIREYRRSNFCHIFYESTTKSEANNATNSRLT